MLGKQKTRLSWCRRRLVTTRVERLCPGTRTPFSIFENSTRCVSLLKHAHTVLICVSRSAAVHSGILLTPSPRKAQTGRAASLFFHPFGRPLGCRISPT